jgi:hypothetical protein
MISTRNIKVVPWHDKCLTCGGNYVAMMWDISSTKSELYLLGKSSLFSWWCGWGLLSLQHDTRSLGVPDIFIPVFLWNVTNYPVMQHHIPQKRGLLYLQELKTNNPKYKHSEFLFWPTVMHSDTAAQLPAHPFSRIHWNNFTKCFIICTCHPAPSRSWHSAIHSSVDISIYMLHSMWEYRERDP